MKMWRVVLVGAFVVAISAKFIWPSWLEHFMAPNQINKVHHDLKADIFDTYMLALQWPPAKCTGKSRVKITCKKPFLDDFKIHGLWPESAGKPVPPYNEDKSCTNVTPVEPSQMMGRLKKQTVDNLKNNWPNFTDFGSKDANEVFWRYEWMRHGMCSDWPDEPNDYFKAGLEIHRLKFTSLLSTLQGEEIEPDADKRYKVGKISDVLRSAYGGTNRAFPEISCNEDENNVKMLLEVRFCLKRGANKKTPTVVVKCRDKFSNKCSTEDDEVKFPPAAKTPDFQTESDDVQYA